MKYNTVIVFLSLMVIDEIKADTFLDTEQLAEHRSFNDGLSERQSSAITPQITMLVLIGTLIGFTLFNFGLASRVQELPNRQDTLETRFSGLEATLSTANSHLSTTSQCMAANVGWTSTVKALTTPTADLAQLVNFASGILGATTAPTDCTQLPLLIAAAGR